MAGFFSRMKEKLAAAGPEPHEHGEDYVELGAEGNPESQIMTVRSYTLEDFEGVKPILDVLREGHTIALINIKSLKDKDIIELKRAINKLKKTTDAIEGDIAGFGDNWIAACPQRARVHRQKPKMAAQPEAEPEVTEYE